MTAALCTADGCGRVEQLRRGLCNLHYKRLRQSAVLTQPTPAERFWSKVDRSGDCWLWTGALHQRGGYGAVNIGGRVRKAQQVAWELSVGPISPGLVLDHLCRVPQCVNPEHLEPVTSAENARRANERGYFGNPNTCERGHDWTVHPPQLARRSSGRVSRSCRVCAAERRRERAS